MTDSEEIQLGVALEERWPGKFKANDIRCWCKHFDRTPLSKITGAIIEWSNHEWGKYPPKIEEIAKLIIAHEAPPPKQVQRSTATATDVLRANPELSQYSDAALHLVFHRG